jgi:hypothetical protein
VFLLVVLTDKIKGIYGTSIPSIIRKFWRPESSWDTSYTIQGQYYKESHKNTIGGSWLRNAYSIRDDSDHKGRGISSVPELLLAAEEHYDCRNSFVLSIEHGSLRQSFFWQFSYKSYFEKKLFKENMSLWAYSSSSPSSFPTSFPSLSPSSSTSVAVLSL